MKKSFKLKFYGITCEPIDIDKNSIFAHCLHLTLLHSIIFLLARFLHNKKNSSLMMIKSKNKRKRRVSWGNVGMYIEGHITLQFVEMILNIFMCISHIVYNITNWYRFYLKFMYVLKWARSFLCRARERETRREGGWGWGYIHL